MHIILFGPGPRFKGGIAHYTASLARALGGLRDQDPTLTLELVSWTQQYPALIPRDFIDRASREDVLKGTQVQVTYLTNYNRPWTWAHTVRYMLDRNPDKVIIQWALAIQGLPLGWMIKRLARASRTTHPGLEVVLDLHLVAQKEASALDRRLSSYALRHAHTYVVHAQKTADELKALFPDKKLHITPGRVRSAPGGAQQVIRLYHPVYDLFTPNPTLDVTAVKQELGLGPRVLLFFGFIRRYKGLHWALQAFAELCKTRQDVTLLVVGESFWDTVDRRRWTTRLKSAVFDALLRLIKPGAAQERNYRPLELINTLGLQNRVVVINRFVPNEEVHRYFQVADALVLFYLTATPSGVESIAYNFQVPMVATRVGHFPETIREGETGYLAHPDNIPSMAAALARVLDQPPDRRHLAQEAQQKSWAAYARAVLGLA